MVLILLLAAVVLLFWMHGRINAVERRISEIEGLRDWSAQASPGRDAFEAREAAQRNAPAVADPVVEAAPAAIARVWHSEPVPIDPEPIGEDPVADAESGLGGLRNFSFEELFGRRLPIWIGGVALAVAGMLIVRYSIELGLLSPRVRVLGGMMFGTGLIAAAEAALRSEDWIRDRRVGQALSGAGIATLYASILVAANVYGLIAPLPAFVGMAVVTAAAMLLSLRFGAPSALLGLVGGLTAPALVGSPEPNVPMLSLYLALVVGGLCALSGAKRWVWLGIGALIGGFGWGGLMLFDGPLEPASTLAIGFYLLLLGIVLPAVGSAGEQRDRVRIAGSLVAAGQMAMLVALGGFTLLDWGLFGLIALAAIWLSREERFALLRPIGLVIALLLMLAWRDAAAADFAIVATGIGLIYGTTALVRLWRPAGRLIDAAQLCTMLCALFLLAVWNFFAADGSTDALFAALAFGLASIAGAAAAWGFNRPERTADARFALLTTSSALLLMAAAAIALPTWIVAPAIAVIAVALLGVSLAADDLRVEWSGWGVLLAALLLLVTSSFALAMLEPGEIARAFGEAATAVPLQSALRWLVVAAAAGIFAWRARRADARIIALGWAALLAYVALAQIWPTSLLPLLPAAGVAVLGASSRSLRSARLLPALGVLVLVTLGWALWPLGIWIGAGLESLGANPIYVTDVAHPRDDLLRLLLPACALAFAGWQMRGQLDQLSRGTLKAIAVVLGTVGVHTLFKQLFAIDSFDDFVRLGVGERLVWQGLLLGAAALAWLAARRIETMRALALTFWTAAGLHMLVYGFLLHNPLWNEQAVGALPLLNLLVPLYGLAGLALWLLARSEPAWAARHPKVLAIVQMAIIALFALSELRQFFHGSILSLPGVPEGEDIGRSVLAIALAIGFLLYGIARQSKEWRIGSLILMLAAVAKVFLLDASGLEALLRIASFVALGFSLIGIGWLYSRQLTEDRR